MSDSEFLGRDSIPRLLLKMSAPATVGLLVSAVYNLVDTIFIGRFVGAMAIGGVAIALPMMMFTMGIGMMLGMGASSVISRKLGAGRDAEAARAAGNVLVISAAIGALFMVLGFLFLDPLLRLFGAGGGMYGYARDYLSIILTGSVFTSFSLAAMNILRSEGRATEAMVMLLIGAGLNIVLDPVCIVLLDMGIRGEALATVISYGLSAVYALHFFLRGKSSLPFSIRSFVPEGKTLGEVFAMGVPGFLRQFANALMFITINNTLNLYGDEYSIPAYGIVFRILLFLTMPLAGIGQGFQPIMSYNFGAGDRRRASVVLRWSLAISTAYALGAFLLLMIFPATVLRLFTGDTALVRAGIPALRNITLIFPLLGVHTFGGMYFLSIGRAVPAFILMLSRKLILLVPLILILPPLFGLNGVWYAFPVSDLVSTTGAGLWMYVDIRGRTRAA